MDSVQWMVTLIWSFLGYAHVFREFKSILPDGEVRHLIAVLNQHYRLASGYEVGG